MLCSSALSPERAAAPAQVKEQAEPAVEELAGTMEQAAQNISEQAVPAARAVGEQVEDGAQKLKKNAGPAANDAVAGARKARPPPPPPRGAAAGRAPPAPPPPPPPLRRPALRTRCGAELCGVGERRSGCTRVGRRATTAGKNRPGKIDNLQHEGQLSGAPDL